MKTFPNDPCPCGSGKKYKKCCDRIVVTEIPKLSKEESRKQLAALLGIAAMLEDKKGDSNASSVCNTAQ